MKELLSLHRAESLRQRLLIAIVSPLLILAILLAIGGAILINSLTEQLSDRLLIGSLTAIAETVAIEENEITLDLPAAAFGMLEDAEKDNVYYSIRQRNALITGYSDLPSVAPAELEIGVPTARTEKFRGANVRIAAFAKLLPPFNEPIVVQVAETMKARDKLRIRLAVILAALVAILVLATGLLVPPAVRRGLQPLERLRKEVEMRSLQAGVDLSPVAAETAPSELKPFIRAFNELLNHVESATSSMRQFVGDASHQMRTPLAALRTHLALARRVAEPKRSPGAHDPLAEVDAAALRLERLITQLLSLARAEEDGSQPRLSLIDICEQSKVITAEWAPAALASGIEISFEGPDKRILALAEPLLLRELLANVIDNAIRYNRTAGQVVVRVRENPGSAEIEVEDTGPGLTPRQQEQVLARFSRLARDAHVPGTGLGLAIVEKLSARLGADLQLISADPEGGLIVRLGLATRETANA